MPRKDDLRPDFERGTGKRAIQKLFATIQRLGPKHVIEHFTSDEAQRRFIDRAWHGRVLPEEREGYALRQREMIGLPPGLLKARYAFLNPSDAPLSQHDLTTFCSRLIVARSSRDRKVAGDVATATQLATLMLPGPDGIQTVADQCDAMWALRGTDPDVFLAGILGDFPACPKLLAAVPAERCDQAIRALARQRIIWNLFDQHRVGACSHLATRHLTPWFLRPFVKNDTVNSYINAIVTASTSMEILYQKVENAESLGLDKARVRGPQQVVIDRLRDLAGPQHNTAGLPAQLRAERDYIRKRTANFIEVLKAIRDNPERDKYQDLHEWYFVLSALAGSYAVAYRVAEDEAEMMKIIAQPANHQALFDVTPRPFPRVPNAALHSRATRLLAAYRAVFLGGGPYNPTAVKDTEVAQLAGRAFWARMSTSNSVSLKELEAVEHFDLSHWARAGSSGL